MTDFVRIVEADDGWRWRLVAFAGGRVLDTGGPHATKKACVADAVGAHPHARVEQKPAAQHSSARQQGVPSHDKFQPFPEDARVHDSFLTVPVDVGGEDEDGDDSRMPEKAPMLPRRLLARLTVKRG